MTIDINIENSDKKSEEYQFRRVQAIMGEHSFSFVIPKIYATGIGIKKGDFVKVLRDGDRLIVEKA